MKWRNGKYEKIVSNNDKQNPVFSVLICHFDSNGDLSFVSGLDFSSRPLALAYASRRRLARLHPGRLFDLTVSEGGDYDYV